MAEHRTDEELVESLKQWWADNGRVLMLAVAIGVGGAGGWFLWQDHDQRQAEASATLFQTARTALANDDAGALQQAGDTILSEHPDRGYAIAASLMLAKAALEEGRAEEAKARLQWAMDNTGDDLPELHMVTRMRLAEVRYAMGEYDEAEALVADIEDGPFAGMANELLGDIYYARGDFEEARAAWETAASWFVDSPGSEERVTLKLSDLGQLNTPPLAQ